MARVVVIGLGHGGMMVAANLAGRVKELYLIEPNPYHQLLYRIHLIAAGLEDSSSVILPLNSIFNDYGVKVINDTAYKIDLNNRLVYTGKDAIKYDYLVIAAGSSVEDYGIEGVRRYAYRLNSVRDAVAINRALKRLPKGSSITVVGGGATGISLAGALAESYKGYYKVRVVEALKSILEGWDRYIVESAYNMLTDDGVEIITGRKVIDVRSNGITLNDGTSINSDLIVWTAGIRAVHIDIVHDVKRGKQGRLVVDRYSRLEGYDDAFAVGDISAYTMNGIVQQSAQFAIRQGYQVAKNILRLIDGYSIKPIVYRQSGRILSLGNRCVGVINGIPVDGLICNYIEEFITYNYIEAIKGKGNNTAILAYEDDPISNTITLMRFIAYLSSRIVYGLHARKEGSSSIRDEFIATLCPLR